MEEPVIAAVVAMGRNRELGKDGKLLWQIPEDLRRFKELTKGHPVILGRKTFESIVSYLGGPLLERTNIVVTRSSTPLGINGPNVIVAHSVEEALAKGKALDALVFVGGGAQIYEAALPYTDKLYLTLIDDEKEGDSFFPAYETEFTQVVHDEAHECNGLKYRWVDLNRK
ncbi:hypothetical protein A3C20_02875 [Candidatus Kaiserbacteria bacterium RIFCSPHIGHO2_02_FULL_55_25]|uniref:Dihydrofolate reductase n=2 Tax=Parcubacteria group TaxID=1794811 RepID=A0A1F4Y0Y1_9BACT|nr:MAG: hypothetical protein A3B33_02570 [Candidatus Adlerbacteria bacterium RIFCSPLOWO2_01_FULL_54_16]OGG53099.1 MAG: hypothetical protein A2764_02485 [Candidatus Kaiserbacteria bacterium RIFCSPHIGHO2_01_FULL_55_79]OGG68881.1 MAG: hypothetical protein A3C20_02875 [Candidatus Kaiserbacteria bacterium RIFCSPHIGHO2_02_FULL_55_25]